MPHRGRRMTPEEPNRSGSRIVRHEALRKFAKPCGFANLRRSFYLTRPFRRHPLCP
jgi:hypothetical protein